MVKRGCRVALGLDGSTLDEDDDALREMRLAHLLHAGTGFTIDVDRAADAANGVPATAAARSPTRTTAARSRRARRPTSCCSTGTRSTHDRLRADLDPLDLLFARATTRHIQELIVAGRTVVRDGRVLGIDYPAMRDDLLARLRAGMRAERARSPPRCRALERAVARTSSPKRPVAEAIMPIAKVHRISAAAPDDVSGIEAAIAAGRIDPAGVIAVLGKTEGNGCVNDFTRGYATLALTPAVRSAICRGRRRAKICLVMSGGTEGGMAPHWTVFERAEGEARHRPGAGDRPRAHGRAAAGASRPRWRRSRWSRTACAPRWPMPASTIPPTCISCRSNARC